MEWIGIGILLAIGYWLAPFVVAALVGLFAFLGVFVCKLFGGCKDI